MVASFPYRQVKPPLDLDPFDPRQKVNKWCSNFPLNPLYKQAKKGKMKEQDRRPTSFSLVLLVAPIYGLDVQDPSVKEILQ